MPTLPLRRMATTMLPALLVVAAPAPSGAQIATDRPDFVESSATVGRGAFQVETSVAYDARGSGSLRSAAWATPTLLRFGVSTALELRVESDLWVRDASSPAVAGDGGLADVSVGLKWHVLDEANGTPSAALLFHADLPSGSGELRAAGVQPSIRAVAEWTLPGGLALGVMPGLVSVVSDGGRGVAGILGVVMAKELTATWRTFAEVAYERLAQASHGGHLGTVNAGFAWLVSDRLQIDAAGSLGTTSGAPDVAFTVGLSTLLTR